MIVVEDKPWVKVRRLISQIRRPCQSHAQTENRRKYNSSPGRLGIRNAFTFVDIVISATFGDTTPRLVCPGLERGKEQSLQKNMTP